MTTPMRQQYLSLKKQYADCILLFRLGDFYETFDDDAKTVAKVCDVVLTSRPVGNDQRVPLAGVPYHSVDGYIARLIEAGYRVAIAEQVSEPGQGLVEREVRRVVTKGTIVDPGMLDEKRNNYLVAVSFDARGASAGISYCDITTGEFAATQISAHAAETERRVGEELSRLQPSELIVIDWEPAESGLAGLIDNMGPLISTVEPWQVEEETARQSLERHFGVATLDGFGLQHQVEAVRCGGRRGVFGGDAAFRAEPASTAAQLRRGQLHDARRVDPPQLGTHGDDPVGRCEGQLVGRARLHVDADGRALAAAAAQPAAAGRGGDPPPARCARILLSGNASAAGTAPTSARGGRPGAMDEPRGARGGAAA